jgi:NEDD8-activating enzyme E1
MKWIYQQALERAKQFSIEGVTLMLTAGVVKNIIPAVASTNAIVAGMCVHEAFKCLTFCSQKLDNNHQIFGNYSLYSSITKYEPESVTFLLSPNKPQNRTAWFARDKFANCL